MVFLMRDAVIVSACRTAIGSFNGQFADVTAVDLGVAAVTEAIKRAGIPVDQIDEVIMGHVLQAGCGENTARQVALHSGIPQEVPAFTLNKLCGSGMRAISLASQQIKLGDADIIVAGETATFGQPEVRVGIMPGAGGTQRLARAVGKFKAMLICLTGQTFSGREAFDMGLASKVVPDAEVLDAALEIAQTIAKMPPLAIRQIKEVMLAGADAPLETGLMLERKAFQMLFDSADQKEGMRAFLEKRKPSYKGA